MTHDKVVVWLKEAIQWEEESLVAMDLVVAEIGVDFDAEGGTGVVSPPYQVP